MAYTWPACGLQIPSESRGRGSDRTRRENVDSAVNRLADDLPLQASPQIPESIRPSVLEAALDAITLNNQPKEALRFYSSREYRVILKITSFRGRIQDFVLRADILFKR